ncbi:hypothetical protein ABZ863_13505 [Saccharomonospora sp. NPDC046836]|uniref:hypothetical protein n=1 Tax=Saccharomonospora sp. NPDC046836 TaxID=3156921 RepID=UPI0033FFE638
MLSTVGDERRTRPVARRLNDKVDMEPVAQYDYEHIRVEQDDSLNDLLDEVSDAMERLQSRGWADHRHSRRGKGLSAGCDLGQVVATAAANPLAAPVRLQRNIDRYLAIWSHPKFVIGAVHGNCIARASLLMPFTDITVMAEDAGDGSGGRRVCHTDLGRRSWVKAREGDRLRTREPHRWPHGRGVGVGNHAVLPERLLTAVRSRTERIAMTPWDLLAIKKMAINRATEATGVRNAVAGVADADALAHTLPSVHDIHQRLATEGLKQVIRLPRRADVRSVAQPLQEPVYGCVDDGSTHP